MYNTLLFSQHSHDYVEAIIRITKMPAFKYLSVNTYDPYMQSSVKPFMGKVYLYNSRLYCQTRKGEIITYVDVNYNLQVKLTSWTVNSVDVEIDVKNLSIREEHEAAKSECNAILKSLQGLEGSTIYMRVNNQGHILKVFNSSELSQTIFGAYFSEHEVIELLESNPLIATFLSGQIESGTKAEKDFKSILLPTLKVKSELKVEGKKERFVDSKEVHILDKKVLFNKEEQIKLAEQNFGSVIGKNNSYDFNTSITYKKGEDRVLAYSISYSTEEIIGEDVNLFISVGMEKVVQKKDINLKAQIYSTLLKGVSAIF